MWLPAAIDEPAATVGTQQRKRGVGLQCEGIGQPTLKSSRRKGSEVGATPLAQSCGASRRSSRCKRASIVPDGHEVSEVSFQNVSRLVLSRLRVDRVQNNGAPPPKGGLLLKS